MSWFGTGAIGFKYRTSYSGFTWAGAVPIPALGQFDFLPTINQYTADYNYNKTAAVRQESVLNGHLELVMKGERQKIQITLYDITPEDIVLLLSVNQKLVMLRPHIDNPDVEFLAWVTKVEPFYLKNITALDACIVEFESQEFENLTLNNKHYLREGFHFDDGNIVSANSGTNRAVVGSETIATGLINNSLLYYAGLNYTKFVNSQAGENYTLSFWFKVPFTGSVDHFCSIGKADGSEVCWSLSKSTDTGTTCSFASAIEGDVKTFTAPTNSWVHVYLKFVGTNILLYINGALIGTVAFTHSDNTVFLGWSPFMTSLVTGRSFDVTFDECMVIEGYYNGTADVSYWYNNGAGRAYDKDIFFYPFE